MYLEGHWNVGRFHVADAAKQVGHFSVQLWGPRAPVVQHDKEGDHLGRSARTGYQQVDVRDLLQVVKVVANLFVQILRLDVDVDRETKM